MATLILVPVPLAEDAWHTLPSEVYTHTQNLKHYFAENVRTCRRMLRGMHPQLVLENIIIEPIEKSGEWDQQKLRTWLDQGNDVGIMSECGMPSIADPGSEITAWAHAQNIPIHVLTGPSSLMLALAGSGMNGQHFTFNGYLPVQPTERIKALKKLVLQSKTENQTQIFIETPYRNQALLKDMLVHLPPSTRLCIGYSLTSSAAFLKTKTIKEWQHTQVTLEKSPAIFLLHA